MTTQLRGIQVTIGKKVVQSKKEFSVRKRAGKEDLVRRQICGWAHAVQDTLVPVDTWRGGQ